MTEAASEIERDPLLEHVSESGHVSILAWLMLFYVFLPVLAHSLHKVLGFDNEILEAVHSPAHFLMLYICHSVPLLPKPPNFLAAQTDRLLRLRPMWPRQPAQKMMHMLRPIRFGVCVFVF